MAWLGAVAGMAGNVAGNKAAGDATLQGAQTASAIQDMNIALQKELQEKDIARQHPFLDFGYEGVNRLRQGIQAEQSPEYLFRQSQGRNALANMMGISPDVQRAAMTRSQQQLGPEEYANEYSRLIDRVKIGQGQAGSAGQSAMNYGQALANAYGQAGQTNALAQMMYGNQMQQGARQLGEQASSIPAYIYGTNRLAQMNQPTWYQGGQAPSGSAGYGPGL